MNVNKTIENANAWLVENGITEIEFGIGKDSYMGKVFALYNKRQPNEKRRTAICKSPSLGELTSMVTREYNLDYNNRPKIVQ